MSFPCFPEFAIMSFNFTCSGTCTEILALAFLAFNFSVLLILKVFYIIMTFVGYMHYVCLPFLGLWFALHSDSANFYEQKSLKVAEFICYLI
jgi:hypothetical protein